MRYIVFATGFLIIILSSHVTAQTTAFNFQGRLNDGSSPANGRYDLQFKLFDAPSGGNQIATTLDRPNTMLINGAFSTPLDFGSNAFTGNGDRFMEIAVRPAGSPNVFVILGARQQVMAVPFSVRSSTSAYASEASTAGIANIAVLAARAQNADRADLAFDSNRLGTVDADQFLRKTVTNQGSLQMSGAINALGNIGAAGNLGIVGNATQNTPSFGLPKAMIQASYSSPSTSVSKCYNGFSGASTPETCGFTLTEPLGQLIGVYRIDFGFPIRDRFFSVTPISGPFFNFFNYVASVRIESENVLQVFMYRTTSGPDTAPCNFSLIVF